MLCGDLDGKEIQKEWIDVYVQRIHFAVQWEKHSSVKQLYSNKNSF